MNFLHVRHATSILTYAGLRILVDPVFAEKETTPAIPLTPNRRKNPLVSLSTPIDQLLETDFVLSTHLHGDHFDSKAKELINKNQPIVCQAVDAKSLEADGFLNILPVEECLQYQNITITRVDAQHGLCPIAKVMGPTSGYILEAEAEPTIYFTGDTIYNESVKANILKYKPQILILNAGSPKFLYSDRIVMNIMDLEETFKINPNLTFIIVHLDTFNHCIETREDLYEYFSANKLLTLGVNSFYVPKDNELLKQEIFAL